MALVDTQGVRTDVDRSLFGPQGRRWVERKLPEVVTNVAFISVSAFGACVLMLHVSCIETYIYQVHSSSTAAAHSNFK